MARDDIHQCRTEVGKAAEGVHVPYDASRIVRVGEYEHAALIVSHLGKSVEVHRVGAVFVHDERIHHHLALVALRCQTERMIHGRLDNHLLIGLAEHVDDESYALDYARNESHPISLDIPLMVVGNPFGHRWPELCGHIGVSVERVVESAAQCFGYELGSLEVHVSHPHRRKVCSSVAFVEHINSQSTRAVAVDDFVEVVFCRHIICLRIVLLHYKSTFLLLINSSMACHYVLHLATFAHNLFFLTEKIYITNVNT